LKQAEMEIEHLSAGTNERNFSTETLNELSLTSFNNTVLERKAKDDALPEISTEMPPQTEPTTRIFEVIRSGRKIPLCKAAKQKGNVIILSPLEIATSVKSTLTDFPSVEMIRLQIFNPKARAFPANSSAILFHYGTQAPLF